MKYHSEGMKGIPFANKEIDMCHRLFVFVILLILTPSQASSWDDKRTHPALTEEAVKRATGFEGLLTYQLGFEDADVILSNGQDSRPITEWLMEGSRLEDEPLCRAASHFHDPWKPWEESMLAAPPRNGGSSHHA